MFKFIEVKDTDDRTVYINVLRIRSVCIDYQAGVTCIRSGADSYLTREPSEDILRKIREATE